MKTKIFAILLCAVMVFSLAACGGDKDTESKDTKDTQAVSDTKSGDTVYDDSFTLPEDGKIKFGKDNKKSDETNKASETSGKDSGNTSSETTKPADDGSSTGGNPGNDGSWGDVHWNR